MAPGYWNTILCLLAATSALGLRTGQTQITRRAPQLSDSPGNCGSSTADESPPVSTACGEVFDKIATLNETVFYASEVYKCLISVPFHAAVGLRFIEYFNTTIQFQSTLSYLRDPPEGYQQPAVDIQARLADIKEKVMAGYYKNQYAFEADLKRVVQATHDDHLVVEAGLLVPFVFTAPDAISSVSIDGKEAPKIYFTTDIINARNSSKVPPAITKINGEPVVEFLTEFAAMNSFGMVEPHGDWNTLMWHPSLDIRDEWNVFTGGISFYPGDTLNFTLEDNNTIETSWLALYEYQQDTGPLTTGGDFYNYFVLGLEPASLNYAPFVLTEIEQEPEPYKSWFDFTDGAYPSNPDVVQPGLGVVSDGDVTGYFYKSYSTGVLSIPTFMQHMQSAESFSDTVQEFIDGASEAGLTRIVIDLHQNRGGMVGLAYDTFGRFFPDIEPFAGTRRRSHLLGDILGSVLTERATNGALQDDEDYLDDEWVITTKLNAETGVNFQNWTEYSGPRTFRGDQFSLTERYNLSDYEFDYSAFQFVPAGYAKKTKATAKWKPKDIVILTDGTCSSTCSMFVEFMTRQGVRTVVAGGRPEPGPMQVSGSRGAAIYWTDILDDDFRRAGNYSTIANATLPNIPLDSDIRDRGIWTDWIAINLRDQVRAEEKKEEEPIPLQFRYEAADCRIYYTLKNLYNMTQLWLDAASATWDDPSLCVDGSRGFSTTPSEEGKVKPPPPSPSAPACLTADCKIKSQHNPQDWNAEAAGTVSDLIRDNQVIMGGPNRAPETIMVVPSCNIRACQNSVCKGSIDLGCIPQKLKNMCLPRVNQQSGCLNRHDNGKYALKPMVINSGETKSQHAEARWDSIKVSRQFVCMPTKGPDLCPL